MKTRAFPATGAMGIRLERMLKGLLNRRGRVLLCGTCMDARALKPEELLEGCTRSTLDALSEEMLSADKVLVF